MTVMDRAVDQLRREADAAGRRDRFEKLLPYLTGEEPAAPYKKVAAELQLTESAIKTAVQRLRKQLGQALRDGIAETVASPGDVDEEVRYLLSIVRP